MGYIFSNIISCGSDMVDIMAGFSTNKKKHDISNFKSSVFQVWYIDYPLQNRPNVFFLSISHEVDYIPITFH